MGHKSLNLNASSTSGYVKPLTRYFIQLECDKWVSFEYWLLSSCTDSLYNVYFWCCLFYIFCFQYFVIYLCVYVPARAYCCGHVRARSAVNKIRVAFYSTNLVLDTLFQTIIIATVLNNTTVPLLECVMVFRCL